MIHILEEFAYGNITPGEHYFKKDSKYGKALALVASGEKKLLERLGEEDKKIFEAYQDMQSEVNRLTAVKNLIYGYKLGLAMTAEALLTSDELVSGADVL